MRKAKLPVAVALAIVALLALWGGTHLAMDWVVRRSWSALAVAQGGAFLAGAAVATMFVVLWRR